LIIGLVLAPLAYLVGRSLLPEGRLDLGPFLALFGLDGPRSSGGSSLLPPDPSRIVRSEIALVFVRSLLFAVSAGAISTAAAFLTAKALRKWPIRGADGLLLL